MRPNAVFSVDVEDYFHVQAFAGSVNRDQWASFPCRVEANTRRILDLLDRHRVRGTFFILGWVAERYPAIVKEIVARGHEPACHSYWHRLIFEMTPAEFREDTHRAKAVIEDAGGCAVRGYRAPSFSVVPRSTWAWDVLAELGFTYDSSVFPIRHDTYGYLEAPRTPFHVRTPSGTICEYPMTTFRIVTQNMPVGGGGYLRIFPFWYTRLGVRRSRAEGVPLVAYIHPWEVDPGQPRLPGGLLSRFRHYTKLARTEALLEQLLALGSFGSFQDCGFDSRALGRAFAPSGETANV